MFSSYIFWDKEKIDFEKDKEYVISKVLEYWNMKDWESWEKLYWKEEIIRVAKNKFYNLSNRTLALIEVIFDISLPRNKQKNVLKPWYSDIFQKKAIIE